MPEAPEDLPAGLLIPGRVRSPIDAIRLTDCAAESELPARFIFGRLVPGSFERFPDGFRARYASAYISATLVAERNRLRLEVKVERADPFYHVSHEWPADSGQGLLHLLGPAKADLDRGLNAVFETDYNVRYKCGELSSKLGDVGYLPDGYAVSILVPFPMNKKSCANLGRFVDAIHDGPEIFCQGHLEQQVIVTNYREGRCPDLDLEPPAGLFRDINGGLIPASVPAWEGPSGIAHSPPGETGYVLVIDTFLYDLADVLHQLRNDNLIEDDPASELVPQIYDQHLVVVGIEQCAVWSRDRSRRVVLAFTNAWSTSKQKAIKSNRQNFSEQLQTLCRRIEEINRPLLELLHEGPS